LKRIEKNIFEDDKINGGVGLMKSEIDFTKTQYEQLTNENMKLSKELEQKTNLIGQLENKLNQLK
jgi:predicted RNase H-like nuclease (RuvC/YqgF family)